MCAYSNFDGILLSFMKDLKTKNIAINADAMLKVCVCVCVCVLGCLYACLWVCVCVCVCVCVMQCTVYICSCSMFMYKHTHNNVIILSHSRPYSLTPST